MPKTAPSVAEALSTSHRPSRSTTIARLAVGAVFAFSALAVPQAVGPQPVVAASSCTGWTSVTKPPPTIRVLRTASGKVEKVSFRRYVAEVMASGEWPARMRTATLEAGALATKQYAWYHAMKGHHRPYYVSGGQCYDVRDDTDDQLYRPERARPTARQWQAIDRTWNLTLRKNGRFFLTGYRAGVVGECAADANGWKLYARSVEACAARGWSSRRILARYLDPNLRFVWSDTTGPTLRSPAVRLRAGNVLAGAATLSWKAYGSAKGARYEIERRIGDGRWRQVGSAGKRRSTSTWLKPGKKNSFRVKAIGREGKAGPWAYSRRIQPAIRGPVGRTLGAATARVAATKSRTTKPRKARVAFRGRSVGVIARTGPGMGKLKILIDGRKAAVVDLARKQPAKRKLVWARNWSASRRHTIAVKPVAAGSRVDFGGFYILR